MPRRRREKFLGYAEIRKVFDITKVGKVARLHGDRGPGQAALGGVLFTFYMLSGYGLHATGLELDAIASVVIGGTLLAGGVGLVAGTLCGVLMLGLIQTLITFDGSLSAWWTRIVIGALLLAFCLLQRLTQRGEPGAEAG